MLAGISVLARRDPGQNGKSSFFCTANSLGALPRSKAIRYDICTVSGFASDGSLVTFRCSVKRSTPPPSSWYAPHRRVKDRTVLVDVNHNRTKARCVPLRIERNAASGEVALEILGKKYCNFANELVSAADDICSIIS